MFYDYSGCFIIHIRYQDCICLGMKLLAFKVIFKNYWAIDLLGIWMTLDQVNCISINKTHPTQVVDLLIRSD